MRQRRRRPQAGPLTVQPGPGRPPSEVRVGESGIIWQLSMVCTMGGTVSMLCHGAAPIFKLPAPPGHEPPECPRQRLASQGRRCSSI